MSVHSKLLQVQTMLKAPKGQYNTFGKYKYRSCEDILEALKPVLKECDATVSLSDEVITDCEWHYVKAVATFTDLETLESVTTTAFARESKEKKGMDESQITGTASSYARKYALNGMFLIDDTKDEDTNEKQVEKKARAEKVDKETKVDKPSEKVENKPVEKTDRQKNAEMKASVTPDTLPDPNRTPEYRAKRIREEIEATGQDEKKLLDNAGVENWEDLTDARFVTLMAFLEKKKKK